MVIRSPINYSGGQPTIGGTLGSAWESGKKAITGQRASDYGGKPISPSSNYSDISGKIAQSAVDSTTPAAGNRYTGQAWDKYVADPVSNWWGEKVDAPYKKQLGGAKESPERLEDWWREKVEQPWKEMWRSATPDYSSILDDFKQTPTLPNSGGFGGGAGGAGGYQDLSEILRQRALGEAPSVSEMAAKQAQDRNLKQSMALAMAQPRSALGQRAAIQQQALGGQQVAGDLARARLAEQQQAQGAYNQMADIATRRDIAQMQDQRARALAVLEAQMRQKEAEAELAKATMSAGASGLGGLLESLVDKFGGSSGGDGGGGGGSSGTTSSTKLTGTAPVVRGKARREQNSWGG